MATVAERVTIPDIQLPDTDGKPLDSPWHRSEIGLLIESVHQRFPDQSDFFVGGNMIIYYSLEQARRRKFLGPDFFYVKGVERHRPRRYWAVWDEDGRYPDVIIELLSSTAKQDRTTKKEIYEKTFRTPEYFLYNPDTETLEGWRLANRHYQAMEPNDRGWLWSATLGLWLGTWEGTYLGEHATWLRFFDEDGQLVPTPAEAERASAEAERQRAEAERRRAEAAEAELARVKAQSRDRRRS